jgi:hypothetical protein
MDQTAYRYDLGYRAVARAEMLALANGLIAGKLGIIAVARKLHYFADGVEPEVNALLNVFVGIHSDTDALPIGEERALWNAEALHQQEAKIAAAEQGWHDRAVDAARRLVHLLEKTS